ncbi:MAG: EAL domain-containing protein [Sphingobium sp.]|nr:EAL domain-containing protein [Sphingobium sp.]
MPLQDTLERLCVEAENFFDNGRLTVISVDAAATLHLLAAPAFPPLYRNAIEGIMTGPNIGSCGSAIYRNEMVCISDIENDPKWTAFKTMALPLGYRACTSAPIRNAAGDAIGAVAVYFTEKRLPHEKELAVLAECVELCELAIARQERVMDRERRATLDALTGLPNRAAFDDVLAQLRCELPGSWALFVIDVDNLKVTNDTFGHDVGDALIEAVGQRVAAALTPDTVFRTGGDEFTAIIRDSISLHDLHHSAEKILESVAVPLEHEGTVMLPRVTIGGAVLTPQDVRPAAVRRNADFALYHAKETQRGGFVRYWSGIGTRMAHRQDSVRDVFQALEQGRIEAYYQPILKLDTYEIVGFEALCRMVSESGQVVPAALFHDAFADARVASELTRYMLTIVARDLRMWLDAGLPVQHVGLNVTSADFYLGNLLGRIEAAFGEYDVPLDHLIVEVTEDAYIGQRDDVMASGIRALRLKGVKVSLDDFGTGFAALTHLLNVPVDIIKIDQSFVRKLLPGHPGMAIVRGLIQIANDLGIKVVAEGIETREQAETVQALGGQLGQGYAFSKAVSCADAAALLRRHGQYSPYATPFCPKSSVSPISDKHAKTGASGRR